MPSRRNFLTTFIPGSPEPDEEREEGAGGDTQPNRTVNPSWGRREFLRCGAVLSGALALQSAFPVLAEGADEKNVLPEELDTLIQEAMRKFTSTVNSISEGIIPAKKEQSDGPELDTVLDGVLTHIHELVYKYERSKNAPEKVAYDLFMRLTLGESEHGESPHAIVAMLQKRFAEYGQFLNILKPLHGGALFIPCKTETVDFDNYRGIASHVPRATITKIVSTHATVSSKLRKLHEDAYSIQPVARTDGVSMIVVSDPSVRFVAQTMEGVIMINEALVKALYEKLVRTISGENSYLNGFQYESFRHCVCTNELNHLCVDTQFRVGDDWRNFDGGVRGFAIQNGRQVREFLSDASSMSDDPRFAVVTINNIFQGNAEIDRDGNYSVASTGGYAYACHFQLALLEEIFSRKYAQDSADNPIRKTFATCQEIQRRGDKEFGEAVGIANEKLELLYKQVMELDQRKNEAIRKILNTAKEQKKTLVDSESIKTINMNAIMNAFEAEKQFRHDREALAVAIERLNEDVRTRNEIVTDRKRKAVCSLVAELTEEDFEYMRTKYLHMAFGRSADEGGSLWDQLSDRSQKQ